MGLLSNRIGMVRLALLGVAVGVVLSMSAPAMAQFRGPGGRVGEPDVTSEELKRLDEMLSLTEDQELVAGELHSAYLAEVQALGEEARRVSDAARDEFRESRDPSVWRDLGEVMDTFEARKEELSDGFFSDLRLIMTPEQDQRWAQVERFHRRFTSMSNDRGLISGEGVDLIEAVRELDLSEETSGAVRPLLDQYEVEVDRALVERNKAYEEGLAQGRALFFNQDFDAMERLFEQSREAAIKLRDVNQRYARQVLNLLETDQAAKLQREIDERSFPQVYRETYAEKAFEAAAGFEGMSDEVRTRVTELRAAFERDMEAANKKLADAIAESEMTRSVRSMFGRGPRGPGGGNDESEEIRAARDAKRDLSSRMMDRLRSTLGPELASKLPEREGAENWREQALSPQ